MGLGSLWTAQLESVEHYPTHTFRSKGSDDCLQFGEWSRCSITMATPAITTVIIFIFVTYAYVSNRVTLK